MSKSSAFSLDPVKVETFFVEIHVHHAGHIPVQAVLSLSLLLIHIAAQNQSCFPKTLY
jgi:hypothetical protein